MSRTLHALALPAVVLALALAGCGDGSSGGSNSGGPAATDSTATTVEPGPGAFVSLGSVPKLGLVLVDSRGFTLYAFDNDHGGKSSCYGACTKNWLPLLTEGAPQPSNGASAARLSTTRRRDGKAQVTYAGHPLYAFSADRHPGEASGNGFSSYGGTWHALKVSGEDAGG